MRGVFLADQLFRLQSLLRLFYFKAIQRYGSQLRVNRGSLLFFSFCIIIVGDLEQHRRAVNPVVIFRGFASLLDLSNIQTPSGGAAGEEIGDVLAVSKRKGVTKFMGSDAWDRFV